MKPHLISASPGVIDADGLDSLIDGVMAMLAAQGFQLNENARTAVMSGVSTGLQASGHWVDLGDGEGPINVFHFGRRPAGPPALRVVPGGDAGGAA